MLLEASDPAAGSAPCAFLTGPRIVLRGLVESDAGGAYPTWFNDEEVCRYNSHHVRPYRREDALEYIRAVNASANDLVLAITVRE